MTYDQSIVSVIEAALDEHPYCRVCGSSTTVRSDADRILMECSAAAEPRTFPARVVAVLFPHERLTVVS